MRVHPKIDQFRCAACNNGYFGEAPHHCFIRAKENLLTDKNSHVRKHLRTFPKL